MALSLRIGTPDMDFDFDEASLWALDDRGQEVELDLPPAVQEAMQTLWTYARELSGHTHLEA